MIGLFYYWKSSGKETLVTVDGCLELPSLIELLKSIRRSIAKELVSIKREFVQERRKFTGEKYQTLLQRFMQTQLLTIERVCNDTLRKNRVSHGVFERSLGVHASDPDVVSLTDCFEPLSNSTFAASATPDDLELATFLVILHKHEAMLAHELKLRRVLSPTGMVSLQATIADMVYSQFAFDEMQVAAASAKFEDDTEVKKLKTRIRQIQARLMVRKHKLSKSA